MMKARCRPESRAFKYYAACGVYVCAEWMDSFEAFLSHIGPRPAADLSVDRIDPWGNYEPGNVRWATRLEQSRNTRKYRRDHPELSAG
jgi:hypothetical protein